MLTCKQCPGCGDEMKQVACIPPLRGKGSWDLYYCTSCDKTIVDQDSGGEREQQSEVRK
jgi:hypothetical protein